MEALAERVANAYEQAAKTKAEERIRYITAGGDAADFEVDYPAIRARLTAEMMLAAEGRIPNPRNYM